MYDGNKTAVSKLTDFGSLYVGGVTELVGNVQADAQLQVLGSTFLKQLGIDEANNIYYTLRSGSTRTTAGLQCQPTFVSGWTTGGVGDGNSLIAARYPDGTCIVSGALTGPTPAIRGAVTACHFNATTFSKTFIPGHIVHTFADGKGNGSGYAPTVAIDMSGNINIYNVDTTTAGSLTYYFTIVYNRYTQINKYEGSGGF